MRDHVLSLYILIQNCKHYMLWLAVFLAGAGEYRQLDTGRDRHEESALVCLLTLTVVNQFKGLADKITVGRVILFRCRFNKTTATPFFLLAYVCGTTSLDLWQGPFLSAEGCTHMSRQKHVKPPT